VFDGVQKQSSEQFHSHDSGRIAYGLLPAPTSTNHYSLPASYVTDAKSVVATQLSKAGVRLAFVLNNALK
jgi:hypothetical protein